MRKILCKTVLPILITLTTLTTFTACSNQNNSKIENTDYKKMYEDCQYVDLFVTPTGSGTYKEQQLIEEIDVIQNVAEYIWNVPDDTLGHFNIIAYNKNVGRKSDFYNVASRKTLNNSQ